MDKKKYHIFILLCIFGFYSTSMAATISKNDHQNVSHKNYQTITENEFRKIFHKYLHRNLNNQACDVVISRIKITGNVPVPAGRISFQQYQKGKRRLEGHVSLIVVVKINDVVKNKVKLSGWVDIFQPVVCASRDIKRGERIGKDDLYMVKRNISHLSSKILTDMNKIIGFMAKHNVKKDTSLKEWMFEKFPIVDKGDIVTILAESGDLKVTAPGRVLMKGYEGELVKVENLMSKKEIYAKVVSSSMVAVDF
ncbi:MAG: flagellar basal body P-ring formation protein FlgA [Deltaproteobacteria bacterium]|nr:flagellar basal body P-ring formation protein FlgA [Deltaproteobacteria bacterium]MBW2492026.1 flagellar basal body P-ring formation protein FlgA [Deltaproteobacteria bacterium]